MAIHDVNEILGDIERRVKVVRRGWRSALMAARENESSGMSASSWGGDGRGGGDGSSVVERAVLGRASSTGVADLEDALREFDRASVRLATTVGAWAFPQARNDSAGRVVADCGNPYGCPTDGTARKELDGRGLCDPCWYFADSGGRHRTAADIEDRAESIREAARLRMAANRALKACA